ncbi:MAG: metallophosphoesterase family protein [Flavobacteriales bacterium]
MKRILLLSDTHDYFGPEMVRHAADVDEIWHAGDIGSWAVVQSLEATKPLRAVYGNIDDRDIRTALPLHNRFVLEGADIWITHIGGYPGHYPAKIRDALSANPPDIFVTGHSHILKVQFDKRLSLLHLNPGAIGKQGFHQVRTMLKFEIERGTAKNMHVIELQR